MRTVKFFQVFSAILVIAVSLFSFVPVTEAKGYAVGSKLTIEPPPTIQVGGRSTVIMHLVTTKGEPIFNQRVDLFINGAHRRSARTDSSGNITIKLQENTVGTYKLYAIFRGSRVPSYAPASANAELVVTPATIEIHTTPSLPNIKFSLNDKVFASDAYGVARIEVKTAGTYHLELLPLEINDPNIQMDFGRWGDEVFKTSRDIVVQLSEPLQVGLEVSYQVSQKFVDLSGRPVEATRVNSVTLKGSNGTTYTFNDTQPHWLPAGRIVRLNNGLEETKILYSVISVVIDGSNVVSQAQQRFFVNPNDVWPVKLLLYKAHFSARDALFGFPIGSGIRMEYPDGEVQSYAFDPAEGYAIDGLARGIYHVKVTGAKGYAPVTPIALSRDQNVELMVFSYIDLGILAALGLLLSLGLLLFGRPYLMKQTVALGRRLLPANQPAAQARFAERLRAFAARLLPRRKPVGLAVSNSDVEYQVDPSLLSVQVAPPGTQEENALPKAILGAAQDLFIDNGNGEKQVQAQPNHPAGEVESAA
jgi:hypothetical protein